MKLPFLQFYPGDYMRDTRALSLAAKGGWVDILCMLHSSPTRGEMTLPVIGWARVMGATVDQAAAVIDELDAMKVADVIRSDNAGVTVVCRRMARDSITREQTRLRVERHRRNAVAAADSNASVTGQKPETRSQKPETNTEKSEAPLIIPLLLNVPEFLGPWAQWEAIRRKGRKPKSTWEAYFAKQLAWLEPLGLQGAIESVSASARNEWQGLFPPRGGNQQGGPVKRGTSSYEQEKNRHGYTL